MLPPSLISLQSRLLVYGLAICILHSGWPAYQAQIFALAAQVESPDAPHANQPVPPLLSALQDYAVDSSSSSNDGYEPDFDYFDKSIVGRQEPQLNELKNNEKKEMDISPGTTVHFVLRQGQSRLARADDSIPGALEAQEAESFSEEGQNTYMPVSELDQDNHGDSSSPPLERRQAGKMISISANTCRQPTPSSNGTQPARNNPQLVMYVSTQNQKPGPDSTDNLATDPTGVLFDSGFANFSLRTNSDIYIGISAPLLDKDWFGSWHFEVAASTDGPYHSYNDTNPFLFMVDTDSESALFITYNLSESNQPNNTDKWIQSNPFRMYAFPAGVGSPIAGVEHSFCAIKELFNTTNNISVETTITTKFGANLPKSQFHVQGLDNGKVYNGFLVVDGNQSETVQLPGVGSVGGGGKVFQQFNWTTKIDDSCQVIFDLDFCTEVAYAVPSSLEFKFDDDKLKAIYDKQAQDYYLNFSRSLQQVACDTSSDAQYSLARTCKDCERDYKNWLCSVLIPRCEDWSADDDWLQPRNINEPFANGSLTYNGKMDEEFNKTTRERFGFSQSRNPMIDETIKPGPYKEMLPCEDLCFDIVRSCPPQMSFACPEKPGRNVSYGKRSPDPDTLTCNFPGAVVKLTAQGGASMPIVHTGFMIAVALLVAALSW